MKKKRKSPGVGALEFFKKKKKPELRKGELIRPERIEIIPPGEYGLPARRPEGLIPFEEPRKPSMWEVFAPGPPKPKARGAGVFEVFAPKAPPPPPRPEEPKPRPWYEEVVPEEEKGRRREIPIEEILAPGKPRRHEREERWRREEMPEWEKLIIPRHARPMGKWRPPSVQEMARHLEEVLNLDEIFREVLDIVRTPEWQEDVESESRRGRFAVAYLRPITTRELWSDLAAFFGVPFEILDGYFAGARSLREEERAEKAIWDQIFNPLIDTMTQAFATLKPKELTGLFNLVPHIIVTPEGRVIDPDPAEYWLAYQDSLLGPPKLEYR